MSGRFTSSGYWMRPHLTVRERKELERVCGERGVAMSDFCREAVSRAVRDGASRILDDLVSSINDVGRELNEVAHELNSVVRRYGRAMRMKPDERDHLISSLETTAALAANAELLSRTVPDASDGARYVHLRTRFASGDMARPERVGFRLDVGEAKVVKEMCAGKRGAASALARGAIVAELARLKGGDDDQYVVATDQTIRRLILSRTRWRTNEAQIEEACDRLLQVFTSSRFLEDALRRRLLDQVRGVRASSRSACETLEDAFQRATSRIEEI